MVERRLPIVPAVDDGVVVAVGEGAPARQDLRDEDLNPLLVDFYTRISGHPDLAPFFASVDVAAHMPRIVAFWSTLLFQTGRYSGNVFRPHESMPGLTAEHFDIWVGAMEAVVDARAAGANADRMKALAHRIAYSMQLRLGLTPSHD